MEFKVEMLRIKDKAQDSILKTHRPLRKMRTRVITATIYVDPEDSQLINQLRANCTYRIKINSKQHRKESQ